MFGTPNTRSRTWPIYASLAVTLLLWLGCKWLYDDHFADPFKYPAKAASLTATMLMCWCLLLAARLPALERLLGGLDTVYQVHRRLGRLAFFIILAHPLCLAAHRLPSVRGFLAGLWFVPAGGDPYLLGHNTGLALLLCMALLVALSLWFKPPYHVWKFSHEWFGLVMALVVVHILLLDADIAAYQPLRVWMYAWLAAALAAFVWIRFLYRFLGPRHAFQVADVERQGDVLEMTLTPTGAKMDFRPSQFVYLVARKPGIRPEPHPYSIACGYNLEDRIKLGIKVVGDHTRSLTALAAGDPVTLYGPYGRFSDRFLAAERDCVFIAGGIGITPFLGMWHVALHSEERLDPEELPPPLARLHPEMIRSWKSPRVSLFYICSSPEDASFDNDIRREVISSHFHGFAAFHERGHRYELHLTSRQGRFTAAHAASRVPGGLADKLVFLCGPRPMLADLGSQLAQMGLPASRIVVEGFDLL